MDISIWLDDDGLVREAGPFAILERVVKWNGRGHLDSVKDGLLLYYQNKGILHPLNQAPTKTLLCPFCHISKSPRYGFHHDQSRMLPIDGYFEALLTRSKWIAICKYHYKELLDAGICVRAKGREPYKFSDQERKEIARSLTVFQNLNINKGMSTKIQGTLDFHLREVVNSLEGDGVKFSAHDVTQRLRKRINDGLIEITGRQYSTIGDSGGGTIRTQFVTHDEVRDQLHYFFDNGSFPNLDRTNNGRYFEYEPKGTAAASTSQFPASAALPPAAAAALAPPPVVPAPFAAYPPAAAAPLPPPPLSPYPKLEAFAARNKVSKPLLRIKFKGDYFKSRSGRSAFARKCDLTQALNNAGIKHEFDVALANGDAEIVEVI